jgi:hypothetical protein
MSSNYYPCLFALTVLPPKLSKMVTSTMVNSDSSVMRVVANSPLQPQKKVIDSAKRELIDRLLLERISLAGIARAAQVSEQWLQIYVPEKTGLAAAEAVVVGQSGRSSPSQRRTGTWRRTAVIAKRKRLGQ